MIRKGGYWLFGGLALLTAAVLGAAQTPAEPVVRLTAVTAGLEGGPDALRIDILSWSSDSVRSQLVDAWNLLPPAPRTRRRTPPAGRGAGGARGARGGAPPAAGGRGGPRGAGPRGSATDSDRPVATNTPKGALAAALQSLEGVGYIWTSESTGYSIRYAYRWLQADGGERIILATDHRLGAWDGSWKPASGPSGNDPFSILELHLNSEGKGEGKASLSGAVGVDVAANTIALGGYESLPVNLRNVQRRFESPR